MLPTNIKHMVLSRIVTLFILTILSTSILIPAATVRADDCRSKVAATGCKYGLPADQYDALLPQIQAQSAPFGQVIPVASDDLATYAQHAANGTVLKMPSSLTGVLMDAESPFPMAWVVEAIRPSQNPGGAPDPTAAILPRYTRLYLFTSVIANQYRWYLIAPGQWIEVRHLALVKLPQRPDGAAEHWVAVDIAEQILYAYDNDKLVFMTLISAGLPTHPTYLGLFRVRTHYLMADMTGGMGTDDYYWLPNVPYVMYFNNDIGLHGAYWHDGFGYPRSHGCVNMSISDAKWLFNWTLNTDTSVYIWDSR